MRQEKQQQAMETSKSAESHARAARGCGQESLRITAALAGTAAPRIRCRGGTEGSGAAQHPERVSLPAAFAALLPGAAAGEGLRVGRAEGKRNADDTWAWEIALAEGTRRQDAAVATAIPAEQGLHFQCQPPQKREESTNSKGGEAMFCMSIP